jgi:uncharacterized protein involved in exopolysaccharide biosynthesis
MSGLVEADSLTPIAYLRHLGRNWRFAAAAVAVALLAAGMACLSVQKQYTAKAVLLIEPPGGDPRTATAVSPIYLESLKSYEAFASSDSLFAKAVEKFGLDASASLESLKQKVLRVNKAKDTRVLEISVTLPDPAKAQAVLRFLTQQTVDLDRSIAQASDRNMLEMARLEREKARTELLEARKAAEEATRAGSELIMETEAQALVDLKARTEGRRLEAATALASLSDPAEAKAVQAGLTEIGQDLAGIQSQLDKLSAAISQLHARKSRALAELRTAEDTFDSARKRYDEVALTQRFRMEQLRIIDPGIIPQRPSFPNVPLVLLSASLIAFMLSLFWITLQFGFATRREQPARGGLRVASGSGR